MQPQRSRQCKFWRLEVNIKAPEWASPKITSRHLTWKSWKKAFFKSLRDQSNSLAYPIFTQIEESRSWRFISSMCRSSNWKTQLQPGVKKTTRKYRVRYCMVNMVNLNFKFLKLKMHFAVLNCFFSQQNQVSIEKIRFQQHDINSQIRARLATGVLPKSLGQTSYRRCGHSENHHGQRWPWMSI